MRRSFTATVLILAWGTSDPRGDGPASDGTGYPELVQPGQFERHLRHRGRALGGHAAALLLLALPALGPRRGGAHLPHHLLHLAELLDELVDLVGRGAAALGDAP